MCPWEVVRARFHKKTRRSYTLRESRCVAIDFSSTVPKIQNIGHSRRISPL
ncbi:hypothetical protein BHM03_00056032 [Ensete ventricosum]|nr:hypothetical protein BHM03_00056032 [Ensete ventricosum]